MKLAVQIVSSGSTVQLETEHERVYILHTGHADDGHFEAISWLNPNETLNPAYAAFQPEPPPEHGRATEPDPGVGSIVETSPSNFNGTDMTDYVLQRYKDTPEWKDFPYLAQVKGLPANDLPRVMRIAAYLSYHQIKLTGVPGYATGGYSNPTELESHYKSFKTLAEWNKKATLLSDLRGS